MQLATLFYSGFGSVIKTDESKVHGIIFFFDLGLGSVMVMKTDESKVYGTRFWW